MGLVTEISLPSYSVAAPPDCESVGRALDAVVCATFGVGGGRAVGLRCVSLLDHPGHTLDSLAEVILTTGTDRYDPSRTGPLHSAYAPYGVELHVVPCTVSPTSLTSPMSDGGTFYGMTTSVMAETVSDFYIGPPVDRGGLPLRIDLITAYDLSQLEGIQIPFHGEENPPFSASRFRHPDRRAEAVLGVIKVLGD